MPATEGLPQASYQDLRQVGVSPRQIDFERSIAATWAGHFDVVGECWEFNGYREAGYGRIRIGRTRVLLHRHVLSLWLGRPVKDKALHRCSNPPCFRPIHIYEGTQRQNAADRDAAGRTATAERNGRALLTEDAVRRLRADHQDGLSYAQLGVKYGLHRESARAVALRKTWKSVI